MIDPKNEYVVTKRPIAVDNQSIQIVIDTGILLLKESDTIIRSGAVVIEFTDNETLQHFTEPYENMVLVAKD